MTTNKKSTWMLPAALIVATAGAAFAADLDTSGQAGQYAASRAPVRVKGTSGNFAASTVYAPFILLLDTLAEPPAPPAADNGGPYPRNSLLNSPCIANIGGNPVTGVGTFNTAYYNTTADRVNAICGTTDAAGGGFSNDVVLDENASPNLAGAKQKSKSDPAGALTAQGDFVFMEKFGPTGTGVTTTQNNIGSVTGITGALAQTPAPGYIPANHVLLPAVVGVGDATETSVTVQNATVRGQVFIGVPSATRDAANDLLTAETHFNSGPDALTAGQVPACLNGISVYRNFGNDPRAGGVGVYTGGGTNDACGSPSAVHVASWLQSGCPIPVNPAGESVVDVRQTKPVIKLVNTQAGGQLVYVAHGVGFSGSTPFSGGSARPLMLAVDQLRADYAGGNGVAENNTIIIEADAGGGVGAQHGKPFQGNGPGPVQPGFADHFTASLTQKFCDTQATGGGEGPNSQTMFDMNAKGQVAAIWVDESVSPQTYQVRLYNPIWNGAGTAIAGFTLAKIITFNGDVDNNSNTLIVAELKNTIETTPGSGVFVETRLSPFSGVSIDDNGRVAFVGVTEKIETLGDWDANAFTPDTVLLRNTTADLFVWEPTTDSLWSIVRGGQSGDSIADGFAGGGTNESLALGVFPVDFSSDCFSREGFSATGGFLAVNWRNGGNSITTGNVNHEYETLPPLATPDNFLDRGGNLFTGSGATLNERSARGTLVVRLGAFSAAPPCCLGNADKVAPGAVSFADITAVLANFNTNYGPGNTGNGDSDCNGVVNFADITAVLANFNAVCP